MSRVVFCVAMLTLLIAPPARADGRLIAVLPLDAHQAMGKMDGEARDSLREKLRAVLASTLPSNEWTVMSDEDMLQGFDDNGVEPARCESDFCHLSMARKLGTEAFLAVAIQSADGHFTASIRLIATKTGTRLASAAVTGVTAAALGEAFEAQAKDFFVQGGLLEGEPSPAAEEEAAPPADAGEAPEAVGSLTVTGTPKSHVHLELVDPKGNKHVAGASFLDRQAMPGHWTATASAPGYAEEVQELEVTADEETEIQFELKALGVLSIQGQPAGSTVVVDGPGDFHQQGTLPWTARDLRSGTYRVKVSQTGFFEENQSVTLSPGQRAALKIALQQETPLTIQQRACAAGEPPGCAALAAMYEQGTEVKKDLTQAIVFYRKACDANHAGACVRLGEIYVHGTHVAADATRAARLFRKACDLNEKQACAELGALFLRGKGVEKDGWQAASLYQQACDLGHAPACTTLGGMYGNGHGVEKDDAKAATLYQRGCDGGDGDGCVSLGWVTSLGRGVSADQARSAALYDRSCKMADSFGCASSDLLQAHLDAAQLSETMTALIACMNGAIPECSRLGERYAAGQGIPQDDKRAREFFGRACKEGDSKACERKDAPGAQVSTGQ